ncbi:hypoxanthine phosphoribosyltransferase [Chloroflexi bacterium TSY]|nr:hypoxanthine phosphoribosyltransferase [Chloroflexi bacterium TSY]
MSLNSSDTQLQADVRLALVQNEKKHNDIERILISSQALRKRVEELGRVISREYAGQEPLLISVLKGSFVFMADLIRAIDMTHQVDFMAISSYGSGVQTSGVVQIMMDLKTPIEGRNVLIVEDIIDSGNTLSYLQRILYERLPASLRIMTLLDKPERREVDIPIDWVGFSIPNEFVVGYGLDYAENYRNLPYIGVLKPNIYQAGA